MFRGFREFVLRGNIVDLITAFVLGHAVHTLVLQFSKSFSEPFIRSLDGNAPARAGVVFINGVAFDWAAFASSVLHLCLVAVVMYFIVITPIDRIKRRLAIGPETDPLEVAQEHAALLREIRDLLKRS